MQLMLQQLHNWKFSMEVQLSKLQKSKSLRSLLMIDFFGSINKCRLGVELIKNRSMSYSAWWKVLVSVYCAILFGWICCCHVISVLSVCNENPSARCINNFSSWLAVIRLDFESATEIYLQYWSCWMQKHFEYKNILTNTLMCFCWSQAAHLLQCLGHLSLPLSVGW